MAYLIVAFNPHATSVGFMGVENQRLEMLFITPEEKGKGLGKELLQRGIPNYAVNELTVNEQNPQAKGFYEHMGIKVYKRTDNDELGIRIHYSICVCSGNIYLWWTSCI